MLQVSLAPSREEQEAAMAKAAATAGYGEVGE